MDESQYEDIVHDAVIRDGVESCMEVHTEATEEDSLPVAKSAVYIKDGYDLGYEEQGFRKLMAQRRTFEEWECLPQKLNVTPLELETAYRRLSTAPVETRKISTKFIAVAATQLRVKLGRLAPNDANKLVCEMEYLRICRKGSVRATDIDVHRAHVLNAYFSSSAGDRVAACRARQPAWIKRALGYSIPGAGPDVC
jgi:hypothetical protein